MTKEKLSLVYENSDGEKVEICKIYNAPMLPWDIINIIYLFLKAMKYEYEKIATMININNYDDLEDRGR